MAILQDAKTRVSQLAQSFAQNFGNVLREAVNPKPVQTRLAENIIQRARQVVQNTLQSVKDDLSKRAVIAQQDIEQSVARIKYDLGIPASINDPLRPGSTLYNIGSGLQNINNTLINAPVVGDVAYRIPKEYGTMAGENIASGINRFRTGQNANVLGIDVPAPIAGAGEIGLGLLNLTPAGIAGTYAFEGVKGGSEQVFGNDSIIPTGLGLVAAIVTPGPGDNAVAISKLKKYEGLVGEATKYDEVANFKKFLSTTGEDITKLKKDFGSVDNFFKIVQNKKSQIGQALRSMNKGIADETAAQSGVRRMFGLSPEDVYTTPLQKIQSKVTNEAQKFERFMDNTLKTSPKQRVNIIDYLRTPDRVLSKLGLQKEADNIRLSWDKYLEELPVEINKITNWSKQVSPDSNKLIFKYLDGQINAKALDSNELRVANEIKSYLKTWADKLKLPEDKRISNYITHIFEKGEDTRDFPEELAAIMRDKVAGSVYDPFLQKRKGGGQYIEDTWKALDAYVKRATRKYHMDPALDAIFQAAEGLEDSQFKYVKSYIDRVQMRPTDIDSLIDNFIKASPIGYKAGARPTAAISRTARQMVYRGLLGLNPASALRNLTQGANTYAELGEKYTILGYSKVFQNFPKFLRGVDTELNEVGVLRDAFIQDRYLSATKKWIEKADTGLFGFFELAERINRGAAYWGAKSKYLAEGLSESQAIQKAKDLVRKTQFTFGQVDTPVAMQSDLAKTIFQFQNYNLKQTEFLVEKIKNKEFAGLLRWVGSTMLMGFTIGKIFGWKPEQMIPFNGGIGVPPTLQAGYGVVTGDQDQVEKGLVNYFPAGGQIRKTLQGIQFNQQGGSYNDSGKLQYPAKGSALEEARAAIFGKSTLPQAQEYYSDPQPLGDKQTETYRRLIENGTPSQVAYDMVTRERQLQDKLEEAQKPQGFNLFGFLQQKSPEPEQAPTEPLFQMLETQRKLDEQEEAVREVFKFATNQEEAERLLKAVGYEGTYEDATFQIMGNLEIPQRAEYLMQLFANTPKSEFVQLRDKLVAKSVFTNAVVDEWLENGTINEDQAKDLKNGIKQAKGTYKPKKPTFRKLAVGKIKVPKSQKIELKKVNFKPLEKASLDSTKYKLK